MPLAILMPIVASMGGVVVTTVTDVMGFLVFLGLGTWILIGIPA